MDCVRESFSHMQTHTYTSHKLTESYLESQLRLTPVSTAVVWHSWAGAGWHGSTPCDQPQCQTVAMAGWQGTLFPSWALCCCMDVTLCVTCVLPPSLLVCGWAGISQTATGCQSNQHTMLSGCTFTEFSGVLLSFVDPWPVLMFITY